MSKVHAKLILTLTSQSSKTDAISRFSDMLSISKLVLKADVH